MTYRWGDNNSFKIYNRGYFVFRRISLNPVSTFKTYKYSRRIHLSQQVVLTTLLVASSTSFVLNAYNYLFLKRLAIYVWFALVPLIWVVCPLTGAAWVTKTYRMYKLVVVNAWVDIPEVNDGRFYFLLFLSVLHQPFQRVFTEMTGENNRFLK